MKNQFFIELNFLFIVSLIKKVVIGVLLHMQFFYTPGGIKKHSGLRHVTLHNVTVGDNCCIENIQNYIANYEIGHDTFIENVDIILDRAGIEYH